MNILFAASEAVPFIKSGGLADVTGSLAKAVRNRSQACRVVLPLYGDIDRDSLRGLKYLTHFYVPLGWRSQYCGLFQCGHNGVIYYFLDNEYYFKRRGLYGFFDDAERFAFYSKAVLEMLHHVDFAPDIIHCHDWQTALVPVYLNVFYRHLDKYRELRTVFTIHNIQYQGTFDLKIAADVLGLPQSAADIVEYNKDVNFMKGAIEQCDALTTVSPTYAQEILDPYFAHGLHDLLRQKQYKLRGILNGIDTREYDPRTDPYIECNYTAAEPEGKAENKRALQAEMGLEQDPDRLLIGMISRLVGHKGLDLVRYAFERIMDSGAQFFLLGSGDAQYESFFGHAAERHPGRAAAHIGFQAALARRIYSGADVFLMPSQSEPCGLAQMIAMRYGTLPIVRATGGLRDSVRDFGGEDGNGYNFLTYNADDMLGAIRRALGDFADKELWGEHVRAAMRSDYSWGHSATEYVSLYKQLLGIA